LIRRIERRIKLNDCENTTHYIQLLAESDKEKETLYRELLIGVTSFFRDKEAFEALAKGVLSQLDYSKDVIRIWSAGCSTGEEVYSIAIFISEYLTHCRRSRAAYPC
jgi:two-component system CheB/CheR fusion protein